MSLGLAGEEGDAKIDRLLQIVGHIGQHGKAATDVEAPDDNCDASGAELARDIHRAWILVRLHADQEDDAASVGPANATGDAGRTDHRMHSSQASWVIDTAPPSTLRSAASRTIA